MSFVWFVLTFDSRINLNVWRNQWHFNKLTEYTNFQMWIYSIAFPISSFIFITVAEKRHLLHSNFKKCTAPVTVSKYRLHSQHVLVTASASNSASCNFHEEEHKHHNWCRLQITWASLTFSILWDYQWRHWYYQNSVDIVIFTKYYLGTHSHYSYHPVPLCLHKLHIQYQIRCFIKHTFLKKRGFQ